MVAKKDFLTVLSLDFLLVDRTVVWKVDSKVLNLGALKVAAKADLKVAAKVGLKVDSKVLNLDVLKAAVKADLTVGLKVVWMAVLSVEMLVGLKADQTVGKLVESWVDNLAER